MFTDVDLVEGNIKAAGDFLGFPAFVDVKIKNLVVFGFHPAFDVGEGGVKKIFFPFGIPEGFQFLAGGIN